MNLTEKQLEQNLIYKGKFLDFYCDKIELPNAATSTREYVTHPGAVCILPLTDSGDVVFVEQYRYAIGRILLELPAGKLDAGETPMACAARELEEETGYRAGKLEPLGSVLLAPGYSNEEIWLFRATALTPGPQKNDEDEFTEVVHIPFKEAVAKVLSGEIKDAKTAVALLKQLALMSEE